MTSRSLAPTAPTAPTPMFPGQAAAPPGPCDLTGQVVRTLNGALVLGPADHYLALLDNAVDGRDATPVRGASGLVAPERYL